MKGPLSLYGARPIHGPSLTSFWPPNHNPSGGAFRFSAANFSPVAWLRRWCCEDTPSWSSKWNCQLETHTGWWFQPLWKILVNGKDYPIYCGKKKCSKPPTSISLFSSDSGEFSVLCPRSYHHKPGQSCHDRSHSAIYFMAVTETINLNDIIP